MCFIKDPNHFQIKTAVRPILTYKIVRQMDSGFMTPYVFEEVAVNEVFSACPKEPLYKKRKTLEQGFIHSFSSIQKARITQRFLNKVCETRHVILESYIPAGTDFYFNSLDKEIASKKLLITDVIVK